jgi:hypothetical protein
MDINLLKLGVMVLFMCVSSLSGAWKDSDKKYSGTVLFFAYLLWLVIMFYEIKVLFWAFGFGW